MQMALADLRLATACLLGFVGFFRFQEIRACDCTIEGEMLKVYIASSKNDQLCQGDEVLIARTRSSTCRVDMLEHYMERTSIICNDQCFLFHAIQNTKNGEVLRQSGKIVHTLFLGEFGLILLSKGKSLGIVLFLITSRI